MGDLLQRLRSHHPLECPGNDCTLCGAATRIESLQTKVEELEYKLNEAIAIAEREVILRKELQAKIEDLEKIIALASYHTASVNELLYRALDLEDE